jgi:hypothetical protein
MRKKFVVHLLRVLLLMIICGAGLPLAELAQAQIARSPSTSKPAGLQVAGGPIPTRVLVQSPAETPTELQIICLFTSAPENALHGSLVEMNEKLKGLLDQLRKRTLFRGELGETLLIEPPTGSLGAKKLLIIGLGDSQTFMSQRMELIGSIVYRESNRLGIAHPYFAPTILDGGVTKFTTGDVAENFTTGFLRAARTEKLLKKADASQPQALQDLTFLAGAAHAADTRKGIERAFAAEAK